jgi:hypothetical protein
VGTTTNYGWVFDDATDDVNTFPTRLANLAQDIDTDLKNGLAAKLTTPGAWTAYTPTLTSSGVALVLGTGFSADGAYALLGKVCHWRARIAFGTTGQSAGTGDYRIGLPQTAKSIVDIAASGYIFDASTNEVKTVVCEPVNGALDKVYMRFTAGNFGLVRSDTPWTWAASDYLLVAGSFEIA